MYIRERKDFEVEGRTIYVVLARSSPKTPVAEKSGVIRVKDYKQSLVMETDGAGGTKGRNAVIWVWGPGEDRLAIKRHYHAKRTKHNMNSVSVFMNYFDNPGGMIPNWLINWGAKVCIHTHSYPVPIHAFTHLHAQTYTHMHTCTHTNTLYKLLKLMLKRISQQKEIGI